MTKLTKEFSFKLNDDMSPGRAYFIGCTFGPLLFNLLYREDGLELLKEALKEYPDIEIVHY